MTRIRVTVPASAANLGPGFDTLGLALALHNEILLEEDQQVTVTIAGEGARTLPRSEQNVVVRGARAVYQALGRPFRGLRVSMRNQIPPSRGLGSSAAAWLGGIVGANALLGDVLDADQVLALAAQQEGHPDNVAAAFLGGLTVSCWNNDRIAAVKLPVAASFSWVVCIPDRAGSTAEARALLPETVSRADAVFNVSRACLLLAALSQGRQDLLTVAMDDRLHQPYRRKLFPWMDAVMAEARSAGALGSVLSGAGPSILSVVDRNPEHVADAIRKLLPALSLSGRVEVVAVDLRGAHAEHE
ncbi:MAG TPA: homoserine kinase [Methylomirabilota bacterium]|nr:homoserine kinase [Methylomirabilota bacterium]